MIPHIRQADGQIGFYWVTPSGQPATLPELMETDREPERLLPTHMSALDDALIDAVGPEGMYLMVNAKSEAEAQALLKSINWPA